MANSIIHLLLFESCFSLFEPDLDFLRWVRFRGDCRLSVRYRYRGDCRLYSIIHLLLFESCFSLFEPDLDFLRWVRFRGDCRLSVRYRYRGDCRLSKQDASAYCKEEGGSSHVDVERGMLRYIPDSVGPGELGTRGRLLGQSL